MSEGALKNDQPASEDVAISTVEDVTRRAQHSYKRTCMTCGELSHRDAKNVPECLACSDARRVRAALWKWAIPSLISEDVRQGRNRGPVPVIKFSGDKPRRRITRSWDTFDANIKGDKHGHSRDSGNFLRDEEDF